MVDSYLPQGLNCILCFPGFWSCWQRVGVIYSLYVIDFAMPFWSHGSCRPMNPRERCFLPTQGQQYSLVCSGAIRKQPHSAVRRTASWAHLVTVMRNTLCVHRCLPVSACNPDLSRNKSSEEAGKSSWMVWFLISFIRIDMPAGVVIPQTLFKQPRVEISSVWCSTFVKKSYWCICINKFIIRYPINTHIIYIYAYIYNNTHICIFLTYSNAYYFKW